MEHPFFTAAAATRAEALRWLSISEKLLSTRDLLGSRSFAARARDSDPSLTPAAEILAVVDTLLAGDRRIATNQPDFYAVLRLSPPQAAADPDLVAAQYRTLAVLLNPQTNRFPFADQAFRLVVDAWSVLSNPTSKSLYDREIGFYQPRPDPFNLPAPVLQPSFSLLGQYGTHPPQQQVHVQPREFQPHNFIGFNSGTNLVFGSNPGHDPVNTNNHHNNHNQGQENYSNFAGYVASSSSSMANQEQLNNNYNKEKQFQENFSNVGDKDIHNVTNVNVNENVSVNVNENVSENVEEEVIDDEKNENVDGTMEEEEEVEEEEEEEERDDHPGNDDVSSFWTACPYCYYMYEYPRVYVDCTMRCQNCKLAYQAVVIASPPPFVDGQEAYFCCWGFIPLGCAGGNKKVYERKSSTPWVYIDDDDDDDLLEISSSSESDVDWTNNRDKRRKSNGRNVKGKEATRTTTPNRTTKKVLADVSTNGVEMANTMAGGRSKTKVAVTPRKQPSRMAKNFGKLDLNVELCNEAEEPPPIKNQGNGPSHGADDIIEGIGFFEGLDELFSNLPILNVVGDDKVVEAA